LTHDTEFDFKAAAKITDLKVQSVFLPLPKR